MTKPKYLTAAELGILPAERKALIAFVEAPALGRIVSVNGKAHYYNQGQVDIPNTAAEHECGTAGCVAGFVFAHARHVQKLKLLRGASGARGYAEAAWEVDADDNPVCPLLSDIYAQGNNEIALAKARKVVAHALTTGKVKW